MSRLLGRDGELAAAADFLGGLAAGPGALVLAGEPGIGKTTVWRRAVSLAKAQGHCVLVARPVETELQLGFSVLADLLEPAADKTLPELPEPQRRALSVALLRESPGQGRLDARAISAGALSVLRALARGGPVVLALDDLQWLDRPSARALEFVGRRLGSLPVGLLACERVDPVSVAPLSGEQFAPEGRVSRIELGPLSLGALHQVLAERLDRRFPRRTLLRIERVSGGNPFFALEIARAVPEDLHPSDPLRLPANLIELVERRVAHFPPRTRALLLVASAARAPTAELLAATLRAAPASVRRALEPAAAAGVADLAGRRVRFAHPLFASAVYSSAPSAERRRIHRRLAGLVDELEERARQLALAADGPDESVAAVLDEAAEHARRRGAPAGAAELADHARRLTPPGRRDDLHRRTIRVAEYQLATGDLPPAREALESVLAENPARPLTAEALRLLGDVRARQDSLTEAIGLFEQAIGLVADDPGAAAELEIRVAYIRVNTGDFGGAPPHARRALELSEEAGDPAQIGEALAVTAMVEFLAGQGIDRRRLERALELEDPQRQVGVELRPSLIAGCLELYVGELDRAAEILAPLRERVIERGEESDLTFVSCYIAWALAWRGDLGAARPYADEAYEAAVRIEAGPARAVALAFRAVQAAFAGDAEVALACAADSAALAAATGISIAPFWAAWSIALLALSRGDYAAAESALSPFLPIVEQAVEPVVVFYLPEEIEALIGLDRLDDAQWLLDRFEALARRVDRSWARAACLRCRALLLAARGDLEAAAAAAAVAADLGATLQFRLDHARTLLVAGQIERRRRRKQAARDRFGAALAAFEAAGAALWAERARLELERSASRRTGDTLTRSEERVARLAAQGLKNREVAAALFVSPKTVEATLARVYRKLDIHSRAALGARFAAAGRDAVRPAPP